MNYHLNVGYTMNNSETNCHFETQPNYQYNISSSVRKEQSNIQQGVDICRHNFDETILSK